MWVWPVSPTVCLSASPMSCQSLFSWTREVLGNFAETLLEQALPNYIWRTKSSPLPVFINKVFLVGNHPHVLGCSSSIAAELWQAEWSVKTHQTLLRKNLPSPSLEQEKTWALEPGFICSTKKLLRTSCPSEGNSGSSVAPFSLQCFWDVRGARGSLPGKCCRGEFLRVWI